MDIHIILRRLLDWQSASLMSCLLLDLPNRDATSILQMESTDFLYMFRTSQIPYYVMLNDYEISQHAIIHPPPRASSFMCFPMVLP